MERLANADPTPVTPSLSWMFIAKAGELAAGLGNISFEEGDGRALRFADDEFDVVVCHFASFVARKPG